jgi:hypothetical protein
MTLSLYKMCVALRSIINKLSLTVETSLAKKRGKGESALFILNSLSYPPCHAAPISSLTCRIFRKQKFTYFYQLSSQRAHRRVNYRVTAYISLDIYSTAQLCMGWWLEER